MTVTSLDVLSWKLFCNLGYTISGAQFTFIILLKFYLRGNKALSKRCCSLLFTQAISVNVHIRLRP